VAAGEPRVVVTGAGLVCSVADSPAALHEALSTGRSGVRPTDAFGGHGLRCEQAAAMESFAPTDYLGRRNLRPLDRTARLVAAAAGLALPEDGWPEDLPEVGLVLGTTFGSIHTISEFDRRGLVDGPNYLKPMDFANSVINAAAGQGAIWHRLRGVNATVSGGATAGIEALAYAADLIRRGRAQVVLAGGAEELCFESFFGFDRAGWLAPGRETRPVPFHPRRNGFVPGEGAALLVLEDAACARARGATAIAEVLGHGARFDPSRGGRRSLAVRTLAGAVREALHDARLAPARIQAVSAGASGGVAADAVEAAALAEVFGAAAATLPVTAVKGCLGETLGAAGAFQSVALIESMRCGRLPGIAGLDEHEEGFPLKAAGPAPRELRLTRGLVCASSHDGGAAALVLGSVGPEKE